MSEGPSSYSQIPSLINEVQYYMKKMFFRMDQRYTWNQKKLLKLIIRAKIYYLWTTFFLFS